MCFRLTRKKCFTFSAETRVLFAGQYEMRCVGVKGEICNACYIIMRYNKEVLEVGFRRNQNFKFSFNCSIDKS